MKLGAGKKYKAVAAKVDVLTRYPLTEAIALAKEVSYAKFGGTLEVHVVTNANPKYNDQMLRGTVVLPHGTGKKVKVAAFVSDDQIDEAKKAGADIAGNTDLMQAIENGQINFDVLITTTEMMRDCNL
jgi:large subunit ribosomal protein L1